MIHILVVDDEQVNLRIIEDSLEDSGYNLSKSTSGECAWVKLASKDVKFSAIVLDRLMPGMDGIEVLKKIKDDSDLRDIPVILQTALGSNQDILDGLQAGAFYYLTKPYSKKVLVSIVNLAVDSYSRYSKAKEDLHKTKSILKYFRKGEFEITFIDEVMDIAPVLSNFFPDPSRTLTGIIEILTNAVEHGNLEIGCDMKQQLLENDVYHTEVQKRQSSTQFKNRKVKITFEKTNEKFTLRVVDEGKGFNYNEWGKLDLMKDNLFRSSGRGILIARTLSFDELNYIGNGNTLEAIVYNRSSNC
ncbi:MAG: response regulator [Leptospira sp.]|nr:response regulator [Leptospira sp.]